MARKWDRGYSFRSADFSGHREHKYGGASAAPPAGLTEGQRPCARGEWCASPVMAADGGETRREGAPGYQAFCARDELAIGRWLGELPEQYVHLSGELGKPSARGRTVRVPFGPRIALRADVDALMRAIAESLVSWHERVAAIGRLSFPEDRRRDGRAVADAVDVLKPRLTVLLALQREPMRRAIDLRDVAALPDDAEGIVHCAFAEHDADLDGTDAGLEIISLRHLARALLGETRDRPEELTGVPCRADGCGWRSVYRAELPSSEDEPAWWSECARCRDRMTEAEYREWVSLVAAYERNRIRTPAVLENLPGVA